MSLVFLRVWLLLAPVAAFYLPGVAPHEYLDNEKVEIKARTAVAPPPPHHHRRHHTALQPRARCRSRTHTPHQRRQPNRERPAARAVHRPRRPWPHAVPPTRRTPLPRGPGQQTLVDKDAAAVRLLLAALLPPGRGGQQDGEPGRGAPRLRDQELGVRHIDGQDRVPRALQADSRACRGDAAAHADPAGLPRAHDHGQPARRHQDDPRAPRRPDDCHVRARPLPTYLRLHLSTTPRPHTSASTSPPPLAPPQVRPRLPPRLCRVCRAAGLRAGRRLPAQPPAVQSSREITRDHPRSPEITRDHPGGAYLHKHLPTRFVLKYHKDAAFDGARIVGFEACNYSTATSHTRPQSPATRLLPLLPRGRATRAHLGHISGASMRVHMHMHMSCRSSPSPSSTSTRAPGPDAAVLSSHLLLAPLLGPFSDPFPV